MRKSTLFISLLLITTNAGLLLFTPTYLTPEEGVLGAVLISTIILWASGIIAEHLTALLFFLVCMLFSLAPASVVFSGFQTTAFWLIFAGLFIGLAITSTGLGRHIASQLTARIGSHYQRTVYGLAVLGVIFAFLMPSAMGRTVLLVPIALSIAEQLGFEQGSRGRTGIVLALLLGSFIPAFSILTSNVPNIILAGLAESEQDVTLLYGQYLALHFPVLGFLKLLLIGAIVNWLYNDQPRKATPPVVPTGAESDRGQQLRLGITLSVMVLLWMTDFVHGISPAWVALGGALVLIFPRVGVVTQRECMERINYNPLFFVAGILGFGSVISHSGLGLKLADSLLQNLPFNPDAPFLNYLLIALTSTTTGVFTTLPGVPAVITPLADKLTELTGFSIEAILMLQVVGFSTLLLPYQAPPVIIGMQLAGVRMGEAIKVSLLLAALTLLILVPLNYLWWQWLGWIH